MLWRPVSVRYWLVCKDCEHRYESYADRHKLCPLCSGEPRVHGLQELYGLTENDGDDAEEA